MPQKPPNGFEFIFPGPTNQIGTSFYISNKPLFTKNQPPTSPPCNPIQPHNELLFFNLKNAKNIPSKNNPDRMLIICKRGKLNPICTKLNITD